VLHARTLRLARVQCVHVRLAAALLGAGPVVAALAVHALYGAAAAERVTVSRAVPSDADTRRLARGAAARRRGWPRAACGSQRRLEHRGERPARPAEDEVIRRQRMPGVQSRRDAAVRDGHGVPPLQRVREELHAHLLPEKVGLHARHMAQLHEQLALHRGVGVGVQGEPAHKRAPARQAQLRQQRARVRQRKQRRHQLRVTVRRVPRAGARSLNVRGACHAPPAPQLRRRLQPDKRKDGELQRGAAVGGVVAQEQRQDV
jgi:hypothetical protein